MTRLPSLAALAVVLVFVVLYRALFRKVRL